MDENVASELDDVRFRLGWKGYNVTEVDTFLETLHSRLKRGDTISRSEVADKTFRKALKGYDVDDVDNFLEGLAANLTS